MRFVRLFTFFLFLLVTVLAGCGGGSSASTVSTGGSGGSGGSGGGNSFKPRPFPGDFFATPPAPQYGSNFPGNVVYDSVLKEFFFSNPAMNEVEAYSTVDGHRVGAVSVPGAMGLSLSPDGTKLAVGTSTPYVYFVDAAALHVTGQVKIPPSVLDPASGMEPLLPFLMATGPMLIEVAYSLPTGEGNLLSYDPASGAFASANPPGVDVGIYGGAPARSADGNYLAVPTLGQTEMQMAVYAAQTQAYIGFTPGQYSIRTVAANPDGSQFATVGWPSTASTGQYITFWNRSLEQQAQYATQDINIVYSRDGKYLYASELRDVLALNTQTGLPAGYQGLSIATTWPGTLWDTDESNRVYGIADLGAYVASVAQLQSTAPLMPQFLEDTIGFSIGNPNEGPLSGGTQVQFVPTSIGTGSADGLGSTMQAYFGLTPATKDVVATYSSSSDGRNFLTATAPAAAANGPVTVVMTDANNNAALLPGGFSYGPHAHWIDPSAVSASDVTTSTLWADGLEPYNGSSPMVKVGGVSVRTNPLDVAETGTWFELGVYVPGGNPGWSDLKLSFGDGTSETTKNMVQYLTQDRTLGSKAYTSAVYDSSRDRFYMTGADNTIGVFDPESQALLQPMQSSTVSSGAVLGSLALTPDNSKLLASDPTDRSVVVFDLTSNTSTAVNVLLPPNVSATLSAPMPVVAMTGNQAFVILTPWSQNEVQQIDLTQMTVRVRTDVKNAGPFSVAPATMAASTDGSVALLGAPSYAWRYDAAADAFSAPMSLSSSLGDEVAVNGDGTVLGVGALGVDQSLMPLFPFQLVGTNILLPGAGGLRYSAGSQVQVSDMRYGRRLLSMAALPTWSSALAVDPSGKKILACAGASLSYYELAVVPLSVGTVSPAVAIPGTALTVHGNGFVPGTTATIGGKNASCTQVDDQTLQCVVPNVNSGMAPMTLNNPDGQSYSFEAAVNVE